MTASETAVLRRLIAVLLAGLLLLGAGLWLGLAPPVPLPPPAPHFFGTFLGLFGLSLVLWTLGIRDPLLGNWVYEEVPAPSLLTFLLREAPSPVPDTETAAYLDAFEDWLVAGDKTAPPAFPAADPQVKLLYEMGYRAFLSRRLSPEAPRELLLPLIDALAAARARFPAPATHGTPAGAGA